MELIVLSYDLILYLQILSTLKSFKILVIENLLLNFIDLSIFGNFKSLSNLLKEVEPFERNHPTGIDVKKSMTKYVFK